MAVLIYAIVLSWYTLMKHNGFATFAWDLGIFNQAFHTTLFDGRLFYYTCELYLNPSGSYFASKFSPILFIVLPFYAIHPSPEMLLVFKSFVLSLGALPLYFLSKEMIGSKKAGFMMALAYLLNPGLQSSNTFDFQPQIFIPIMIFSTYYFMIKGRWKLYFLFAFLCLAIEEHVAVILFLLSLAKLLSENRLKSLIRTVRTLHPTRPSLVASMLLATLAFSASWYFVSRGVRQSFPIAPEFGEIYRATDSYRVLGFTNDILSLPVYVLMNPQRTFEALSYDFQFKFLYIIFLFAPLLFLSFKSKLSLVVVVLLVPFLLSNYRPYYVLGAHYPLYLLPLVFLAAVEGLSSRAFRIQNTAPKESKIEGSRNSWDLSSTLRIVIVVTLIFAVSISPISPLSQAFLKSPPILWYAQPYSSETYVNTLHEMIGMIPPNASILTQNNIFPHLSSRINAYVIPTIEVQSKSATDALTNYIRQQMNQSDYVLLDSIGLGTEKWTSYVLDQIDNRSDFRAYAVGGSAILFMKGYNGTSFFVPNGNQEIFLGRSDLMIPSGQIIYDKDSNDGNVAFSPNGTDAGVFLYGPYVFLPLGVYEITFEVKLGTHQDGYLATIDVSEGHGTSILSKRDLFGFEAPSNAWINYTLSLSSTQLRRAVEFRIFTNGAADIYLDRVIVKRILTQTATDFGARTYSQRDLSLNGCTINEEGFIVFRQNSSNGVIWYGPYITLPTGYYRATFFLRASSPINSSEKILSLDVTALNGKLFLATRNLYQTDLPNSSNASNWQNIALDFTCGSQTSGVEFRGLDPSPDVDIYLAFILIQKAD